MKSRKYSTVSVAALSLLLVGYTSRSYETPRTEVITVTATQTKGIQQSPLPAPTGTYSIGRTQFDWTDQSRPDPENPGGHREIVVWVWYPASPQSGAQLAEWLPGKWGESFWSDYVSRHPDAAERGKEHPINTICTHAYTDAPVAAAQQKYPVLLFAPGLGTTPLEYASLIEDVVSHGYIVAGIVPTYFARVSVFSNGRVIEGRDIMAASGGDGPTPRTTEQALRRFEQVAGIWSKDLTLTQNKLAILNGDPRSPLKGHFDLNQMGTLGHSLGGAAVLQFANDDARVRAIFDIDGSPIWNAANKDLARPLLILSAASTNVGYDAILNGAKPGKHLRLLGSVHTFSNDFRLIPLIMQSAANPTATRPPEVSSIEPTRALRVTAIYAEAFFDQYLKGKTATLLNGPSPGYPEVVFEH